MDLSNHALTSPPDLLTGICVLHSRAPVALAVALPEGVAGPLAVLLVKLFIAGVTLGLLGIWLKERDVAARIAGMSVGIKAARTGSGVPARLPATGTDPPPRDRDRPDLAIRRGDQPGLRRTGAVPAGTYGKQGPLPSPL